MNENSNFSSGWANTFHSHPDGSEYGHHQDNSSLGQTEYGYDPTSHGNNQPFHLGHQSGQRNAIDLHKTLAFAATSFYNTAYDVERQAERSESHDSLEFQLDSLGRRQISTGELDIARPPSRSTIEKQRNNVAVKGYQRRGKKFQNDVNTKLQNIVEKLEEKLDHVQVSLGKMKGEIMEEIMELRKLILSPSS